MLFQNHHLSPGSRLFGFVFVASQLLLPQHSLSVLRSASVFSADAAFIAENQEEDEDDGLGVDLSFIGSHAFARMEGDIDKQRKLILQGQLSEAALQKQHQRK